MTTHYEPEQIADRLRLIADLVEKHGVTEVPMMHLWAPLFEDDHDAITPLMLDLGDLDVHSDGSGDQLRSNGPVDVRASYRSGRWSTEREVTTTRRVAMSVAEIAAQHAPETRGELETRVIEGVMGDE